MSNKILQFAFLIVLLLAHPVQANKIVTGKIANVSYSKSLAYAAVMQGKLQPGDVVKVQAKNGSFVFLEVQSTEEEYPLMIPLETEFFTTSPSDFRKITIGNSFVYYDQPFAEDSAQVVEEPVEAFDTVYEVDDSSNDMLEEDPEIDGYVDDSINELNEKYVALSQELITIDKERIHLIEELEGKTTSIEELKATNKELQSALENISSKEESLRTKEEEYISKIKELKSTMNQLKGKLQVLNELVKQNLNYDENK